MQIVFVKKEYYELFAHIVYKVPRHFCYFHCLVLTMVCENKAQRIHAGLSAKQTLTEVSLWGMNILTLESHFPPRYNPHKLCIYKYYIHGNT